MCENHKEGVDRGIAHSTYCVTCTHDIISNVPAINTINRRIVYFMTLTL